MEDNCQVSDMTITACVFPGQGSQKPGMLSDLAEAYPEILGTFATASDVLDYDLWQLIQGDNAEELSKTAVQQPAILTSSVAIWRLLQNKGFQTPQIMAGHSLGEYAALVCASVLEFEAAVGLVQKRGQYMQEAVPAGVGAMAAIIGLDDAVVEQACEEAAQGMVVTAVNYNSPGQVVIAGHAEAVERASVLCKEAGAKRALPLPVSAPFHCSLMKPAADRFSLDLAEVSFSEPQIPVIQNFGLRSESNPETIRQNLVSQIFNPVPWVATLKKMVDSGVTEAFEIGPGNVLSGLIKRGCPEISATAVNSPLSVDQVLASQSQ